MNLMKCVAALGLMLALFACGGGGGNPGLPVTGPEAGNNDSIESPVAADFVFQLDKTSIVNTGSDIALLTITALDSSRNTVSAVPVSVSLDNNAVFTEKSGTLTDTTGSFTGKISIGSDKSDRIITVTMNVGAITKKASVVVTGSQITVTPVPSAPTRGQKVTLNISTTDANGAAISGVEVNLSGTAGVEGAVVTGTSGSSTVTFVAPDVPGDYTVLASGLNVTASQIIKVSDTVSILPATGTLSASSLTAQPTSILPNTVGSTTSRSKLSAKFLAANNVGIERMRVRFELLPPLLGNGESISTGYSTVYTNAAGIAEADYIAGTRSSPTNGVKVRACFSPESDDNFINCLTSVSTNLTVAGAPLSVSIGDDNTLTKGLGGIAYLKQFLIQVNDSAGVAVKDAVVSASVDITHYGKGPAWGNPYLNVNVPTIRYVYSDLSPTPPPTLPLSLSPYAYLPLVGENVWCINEDWNRNGSLDTQGTLSTNEDLNQDGVIQPRKAEIVVSYVSGNQTDSSGQLLVQISYPQNMGRWLAYTIRATTSVAGSEGDASRSFVTDVLAEDILNGAFLTPPFGSGACNSPS